MPAAWARRGALVEFTSAERFSQRDALHYLGQ
jgi:hypothetical protein